MNISTLSNKYLICPYCGHAVVVGSETFLSNSLETEEEFECDDCGHTFRGSRRAVLYYDTFKMEERT